MPVVNGKAVESAIRIGLALNCDIAEWCRFARKNYFYPDMPKNFQTSQYDEPIAFDGYMDVDIQNDAGETETFRVEIERAHMEEDTGKSLHVGGATGRIHGADYSLVDYNRAGIPLIEIVTRPIMGAGAKAPEVAKAYVAQLRELIVALGVSEARMDQGNLRADVNLSLAPKGSGVLGTRTETKNVNSFRSVERAVRYEMQRHAVILRDGGSILQETRHWHEDTGITTSGREKSDAEDYRYFPEPDLVPVAPSREWVEELRGTLPENPTARRARLQAEWGFSDLDMRDTIGAGALGLVEETIAAGASPQAARKWWLGELARRSNEDGVDLVDLPITPADVARIQALVDEKTVNDKLARQVIEGVLAGEGTPDEVVASRGLAVVSDDGALGAAVDKAIAANPDVADKIRDGKHAAAGCAHRCGDEGDARAGRRRPGARADPGEARLTGPPFRGLDNLLRWSRVTLVTSPTKRSCHRGDWRLHAVVGSPREREGSHAPSHSTHPHRSGRPRRPSRWAPECSPLRLPRLTPSSALRSAKAAVDTDSTPSTIAAEWMAGELTNGLVVGDFGPDFGLTIDTGMALATVASQGAPSPPSPTRSSRGSPSTSATGPRSPTPARSRRPRPSPAPPRRTRPATAGSTSSPVSRSAPPMSRPTRPRSRRPRRSRAGSSTSRSSATSPTSWASPTPCAP